MNVWRGSFLDKNCLICDKAFIQNVHNQIYCSKPCFWLSKKFAKYQDFSHIKYKELLSLQNNLCAICFDPPKESDRLNIDHNHITGKVRGLLCRVCNVSLGGFKDQIQILLNAIQYLQKEFNV